MDPKFRFLIPLGALLALGNTVLATDGYYRTQPSPPHRAGAFYGNGPEYGGSLGYYPERRYQNHYPSDHRVYGYPYQRHHAYRDDRRHEYDEAARDIRENDYRSSHSRGDDRRYSNRDRYSRYNPHYHGYKNRRQGVGANLSAREDPHGRNPGGRGNRRNRDHDSAGHPTYRRPSFRQERPAYLSR